MMARKKAKNPLNEIRNNLNRVNFCFKILVSEVPKHNQNDYPGWKVDRKMREAESRRVEETSMKG